MAKTLKEQVIKKTKRLDNGCVEWTGSMRKGHPTAFVEQLDGKFTHVHLQRYRMIKKFNLSETTNYVVKLTCGNPRCISKDHIQMEKRNTTARRKINFTGRKCGSMVNNKAVFSARVVQGIDKVSNSTGLSVGTATYISKSEAMMPYFQIKLLQHTGVNYLDELRDLDDDELKTKYQLSKFAIDFIRSGKNYAMRDPDLFDKLLDECEVVGEHLVWIGDKSDTGTPITKAMGNYNRKALPLLVYATLGLSADGEYETDCGFEGCVNPYHCKEVKNETSAET